MSYVSGAGYLTEVEMPAELVRSGTQEERKELIIARVVEEFLGNLGSLPDQDKVQFRFKEEYTPRELRQEVRNLTEIGYHATLLFLDEKLAKQRDRVVRRNNASALVIVGLLVLALAIVFVFTFK